ncbi:MAG: MBL fold metallo-hydrolase [Chloroflexi bacterium]|nr:MBL fold metallo-hydrolase [Chloroflexota bacterium]
MEIELFQTAGLGDASYLIASDGEAALIDPQRDAWRFLEVAERRGWRVTHVLETHVHNDYLSGALEARAATKARIVAPASGGYAFPHLGADEGTTVDVGGLRLTAMATPGHTPEHLAWAVRNADGGRGDRDGARGDPDAPGGQVEAPPEAIFTGGSLLIGTAGRTDLLGPERTAELTALQESTLRRLGALPPGVRILPTHGAGSFCSAGPPAAGGASTIGAERFVNPVLRAVDSGAFAEALLAGLGRFPTYYAQMAPLNRAGPPLLGGLPTPPALDPDAFATAAERGARVIDVRRREAFAAGHVRGSLNIELDETFAAYVGWLVPFDAPLLLVLPEPGAASLDEAVTQLLRIGYGRVAGVLRGGFEAWRGAGRPTSAYPTTSMDAVLAEAAGGSMPELLDVRQPVEWAADGVVEGARTIFVADLPGRLAELPRDRQITVACKAGSRAAIAASLMDAAGFDVRLVASGGMVGIPARFAALERERGAART